MATDVWKCELSFDNFFFTQPPLLDPVLNTVFAIWTVGLEAICLPLLDPFPVSDVATDEGNFFLEVGFMVATQEIDLSSPPGPPLLYQWPRFRFAEPYQFPRNWSATYLTPAFSTTDLTALNAGGTLSIQKDYDANLMTFSGPLGTQSVALTALDGLPSVPTTYYNTTPMRARGYSEYINFSTPSVAYPAYDIHHGNRWYSLIGRQNGTIYDQVALTPADPGTWWPLNNINFIEGVGSIDEGTVPWWQFNQLPARQEILVNVLAASLPDWRIATVWKRRGLAQSATDMDAAPEHGVLWRASAGGAMVMVERSFDNGHSWDMFTVFADATTTNSSPTVNWYNHRLAVTWYDGTNIREAHSLNGGQTWGMPITIPYTGTYPRRVTDRTGGGSFYFYFDVTNHLLVVVTYDQGASYLGPYTVASGVTPQQMDAEFAPDGSLVASLFMGTTWTQYRSRDLGVSWS
jgi:hypothetical protein